MRIGVLTERNLSEGQLSQLFDTARKFDENFKAEHTDQHGFKPQSHWNSDKWCLFFITVNEVDKNPAVQSLKEHDFCLAIYNIVNDKAPVEHDEQDRLYTSNAPAARELQYDY